MRLGVMSAQGYAYARAPVQRTNEETATGATGRVTLALSDPDFRWQLARLRTPRLNEWAARPAQWCGTAARTADEWIFAALLATVRLASLVLERAPAYFEAWEEGATRLARPALAAAEVLRTKFARALLARPSPWANIASNILSLAALGLVLTAAAIHSTVADLPSVSGTSIPPQRVSLTIADANLNVMGRRGIHRGRDAHLADLPPHVPRAFIAIEDKRFYGHVGVDPIGIGRALIANFVAGGIVEGGSTITQQLARRLYLSPAQTLTRKVQEAVIAVRLEMVLTKTEILELYLNRAYFGAGAYGIEAAAETYYNKPAGELTLAEAALLAGIVKAPTRLSNADGMEGARARAEIVLANMRDEDFLAEGEFTDAVAVLHEPNNALIAHTTPNAGVGTAPYLLDWVAASLETVVPGAHGNLFVETTFDPEMQSAAQTALQTAIGEQGEALNVGQGAVVMMDNGGAVRAMVGGVDYERSQYNRAYQARRQPGSAFKPFVYLTALNQGFSPSSVWSDRPIRIDKWTPANYSGRYRGNITLERALTRSVNTVAAGLGNRIGLENVADTARNLGIRSPMRIHPSLPLGTSEVTLLELTGAYAALARGGSSVLPYTISRVLDSDGKVVYEREKRSSSKPGASRAIADLNSMLVGVVEHGTGRAARLRGRHVAGKTGTTQEYRDAWFIGFTDSYTAGVWVGNDDYSPMNEVTGGTLPARIWRDAMLEIVGEDEAEPEPRIALNDTGREEDSGAQFDPFAALDEIDRQNATRMDGVLSYYARAPRVWSAEEFSRSQQQVRRAPQRWSGGFLRRLFNR